MAGGGGGRARPSPAAVRRLPRVCPPAASNVAATFISVVRLRAKMASVRSCFSALCLRVERRDRRERDRRRRLSRCWTPAAHATSAARDGRRHARNLRFSPAIFRPTVAARSAAQQTRAGGGGRKGVSGERVPMGSDEGALVRRVPPWSAAPHATAKVRRRQRRWQPQRPADKPQDRLQERQRRAPRRGQLRRAGVRVRVRRALLGRGQLCAARKVRCAGRGHQHRAAPRRQQAPHSHQADAAAAHLLPLRCGTLPTQRARARVDCGPGRAWTDLSGKRSHVRGLGARTRVQKRTRTRLPRSTASRSSWAA